MSYCVNCGVELDATARACPLCHTPVQNPNRPVDAELPPPFPSRRKEVQPASKKELALPIILTGGAIVTALGLILSRGRSILSSVTLIIGAVGLFVVGIELFVDRWMGGSYEPGWSIVVATVCIALIIPLLVVRHRPALRDEARRRFHM